ncbi:hypothetical protein BKA64DRAFT_646245 [Cadophora sp. MPI-SDFR-AT-0126]|nr:hypothetical protein BKA64DRAFT_646245 [Leotiomycetes sp. MPI-SDFR-AT-0126]
MEDKRSDARSVHHASQRTFPSKGTELRVRDRIFYPYRAPMLSQAVPNLDIAPHSSVKMTIKDVKAIHAQVQRRVVREAMKARISRGPVTMGELFDALLQYKNFDPLDHCFPMLPGNYFARMTTTDRATTAWNFIEPKHIEPSRVTNNTQFRSVSAESRSTVSSVCETTRSQASVSSMTSGGGCQHHCCPSHFSMADFAANSIHNRIKEHSPDHDRAPHMVTQLTRPEGVMGSYTGVPQTMDSPIKQSPFMMNHVLVRYGPIANATMVGYTGCLFSPVMAPTPYVPIEQRLALFASQATLPPPHTPSIHLCFATSRHRMDGKRPLSIETAERAIIAGVNLFSKYKGDVTEDRILNAQCPEKMNTSIHIQGFPVGISETDIVSVIRFAAIRNICLHPAIPGRFATAAADITFFTREAAEYCFNRGKEGAFKFRGKLLKFLWNKNKCRPADAEEMRQSRVLLIEGPEDAICMQSVESLLRQKLVFKLIQRKISRGSNGNVVLLFEFCKLRGQARCAKKLLDEVISKLGLDVMVSYGADPCGPHEFSCFPYFP